MKHRITTEAPPAKPWSSLEGKRAWIGTHFIAAADVLERGRADLRIATRALTRSRGASLAVVLILALGIGANVGIFSIVNGVMLRSLPVSRPDRLVNVYRTVIGPHRNELMSYPDFQDVRALRASFQEVVAFTNFRVPVVAGNRPQIVVGEAVSANYCSTLGLVPVLGRPFVPTDDLGGTPVALISYRFWLRTLAADVSAVGRTVRLRGHDVVVVGVLPAHFSGLYMPSLLPTDIWLPLGVAAGAGVIDVPVLERDIPSLKVKARLREGISLSRAQSHIRVLAAQLERSYPSNIARRFDLRPANQIHITERIDPVALPLGVGALVIAAIVLLLVCANVAGLLLSRSTARHSQTAVRIALGATPSRIVRLALTEYLLLGALGGALGLAVAAQVPSLAVLLSPPVERGVSMSVEAALDGRIVMFALAITLLTGLACGLLPAIRASRVDVAAALTKNGVAGIGNDGVRLGRSLVAGQLALSLVLLLTAGLLARSALSARALHVGYDTTHTAAVGIELSLHNRSVPDGRHFFQRLVSLAHSLPGVTGAAVGSSIPVGGQLGNSTYVVLGLPESDYGPAGLRDRQPTRYARYAAVTPEYFRTMGLALLRGRGFTDSDGEQTPTVAVLSETAATRYWPHQEAIGRRFLIRAGHETVTLEVVGVVADTKTETADRLAARFPWFYVPFAQNYMPDAYVVVRTAGNPRHVLNRLQRAVTELDPTVAPTEALTLAAFLRRQFYLTQLGAYLTGALALAGLLLAAIGLYASLAHSVSLRVREIGIRMALGASRLSILRLVVGEGMRLVMIGGAAGVAVALASGHMLSRFLFGISSRDIGTYAVVCGLLALVALAACLLPALRATRLAPMAALRRS